jgi:hypothetical protein
MMTHDEAREFVERWRKAGLELEKVRREELRAMRHEEQAALIDSLLEVGLLHAQPSTTSGLVEMQRILSRARP